VAVTVVVVHRELSWQTAGMVLGLVQVAVPRSKQNPDVVLDREHQTRAAALVGP